MNTILRLSLCAALAVDAVSASLDVAWKNRADVVDFPITKAAANVYARQATQTCGFKSGDANSPRVPASGWYCATDTVNNYWGFCPSTISNVASCPVARVCQDEFACTSGCGRQGFTSTYSCPSSNHCLEDLLVAGPSTYRYFFCGATSRADEFYYATAGAAPSTKAVSSSKAAASSSAVSSKRPAAASSSVVMSTPTMTSDMQPLSTDTQPLVTDSSVSPGTGTFQAVVSSPTSRSQGATLGYDAALGGALICSVLFLLSYV